METPVEIRYAGVVVARATEILKAPGNESGVFLVIADPLPVGTLLRVGDAAARVEKSVESADPRASGIYVRFLTEGEEALPWVPQLPEVIPLPAPPKIPTPAGVPLVPARPPEAIAARVDGYERRPSVVMAVPPPSPAEGERRSPTIVPVPPPASAIAERGERRTTIQVAVAPPPDPIIPARASRTPVGGTAVPVPVAVETSGEIRVRTSASVPPPRVEVAGRVDVAPASIVINEDDEQNGGGAVEDEMDSSSGESGAVVEEAAVARTGEIGELPPARPLPPPDGRRKTARRRRNTNR